MSSVRSAIISFGLFALALWSAGGYGASLGRALNFSALWPGEQIVWSLTLGLGLLSHLMILAGLCHAWTGAGAWLLLIPGLLLSAPFLIACRRLKPSLPSNEASSCSKDHARPRARLSIFHRLGEGRGPSPSSSPAVAGGGPLIGPSTLPNSIMGSPPATAGNDGKMLPEDLGAWAARGLILFGSILALGLALAPITYYDSLVYHLALPADYVKAGRWVGLPHLIYSAFPQTLEMLWTYGILLGGDALANLIALSLSALALAALILFGRRFLNPRSALWAGALVSAMPAFLLLSSGGYVETGLMLFSFLSFYALKLWSQAKRDAWLILAGLMAGWAMGCKYTGAIPTALVGLFIFKESWGSPPKVLFKHLALYGLPALAMVSPWLIKNSLYVGNPVFPFFYTWGAAKLNPWLQGAAAGYFRGLTEYQPHSFFQLGSLLWGIAAHGLRYGGGMDALGDFGWTPLLASLPALALCRPLGKTVSDLGLYALLFFIPWGMTRPVLRFLMPAAPMLALLAGHAWADGLERLPARLAWVCRTLLALLLVSGFSIFFNLTAVFSPFRVALGLEPREAYLRRKLDYFAAASFTNRLPGATRVLVIGDQRGYYYEKPTVITPVFNENPLVSWANAAPNAEALRDRLREQGFTHLVVNWREMRRLEPYHLFPFNASGRKNWEGLLSRLAKRLYQDKACEVFEL